MKEKLIKIYLPSITCFLALTLVYALSYRLIIKLPSIEAGLFYCMCVIGLGTLISWLLLRRRKDKLQFGKHTNTWHVIYGVIHVILFAFPFLFLQGYLLRQSHRFTALQHINEIKQSEQSEFYSITNPYIHKHASTRYSAVETNLIFLEDQVLRNYMVVPVFEHAADTATGRPVAWLGIVKTHDWGTKLATSAATILKRHYAQEATDAIQQVDPASYHYYQNLNLFRIDEGFRKALLKQPSYRQGDILLLPHETPFDPPNYRHLVGIAVATLGGWLILLLLIYFARPIPPPDGTANALPAQIR